MIAIGIILAAAGHVVRDGWPSFGEGKTNLARAAGALLLIVAALAVGGFTAPAAVLGVAGGIGFWTDRYHATGQQAATMKDMLWLSASGITSLLPLVAGFAYFHQFPAAGLAFALGMWGKPFIWPMAWLVWRKLGESQDTWFVPTRTAALVLGANVGALLWLGSL